MELKVKASPDREVTIGATLDELVDLNDALVARRRSKAQLEILQQFAEMLVAGDKELSKVVKAQAPKSERPHHRNSAQDDKS